MVPTVNLVVTLSGPTSVLTVGANFVINITISHNSTDSRDARNFVVTLGEYIEEYVFPPANFTSVISGRTERIHSENIYSHETYLSTL